MRVSRERASSGLLSDPARWIRGGLVLIALIPAAYVVSVESIANIARSRNPALVHRLTPWDSRAIERLAEDRLQDAQKPADFGAAEVLAKRAIQRDPTSVRAIRVLAFVAESQGKTRQSQALFSYANWLTRRDLPTRLYFIEKAVANEDIPAALQHFDIALKTSSSSFPILMPILANAVREPELRPYMARLFATDPIWLPRFLGEAISVTQHPVEFAETLVLARKSAAVRDASVIHGMLERLWQNNHFLEAEKFFVGMGLDGQEVGALVRDGTFEEKNEFFPFQWSILFEAEVGAEQQVDGGLSYYANSGQGGEVARQLLTLPPGRYSLVTEANNPSTDKLAGPRWILRCAQNQPTRFAEIVIPAGSSGLQSVSATFTIPQTCQAQWLLLELRLTNEPAGLTGHVKSVAVKRLA